jgi:multidrug efflux pump subunit AcrB
MLIAVFTRHRVASNLLMVLMLLSGAWALFKLNTQFFPTFELDFVTVRVVWSGATAEDVAKAITEVIEEELRTVDGLRKLTSTSSDGLASVALEYEEGTDMGVALDQVKERVALIRNLPDGAEEPEISRIVRYEPVARLLIHGPDDLEQLRPVARRVERELLDRGVAKVTITGMPELEVAIQVPAAALHELELSLDQIAERVSALSRDIPAGTVGRDDTARQLRALEQQRSALEFDDLPILSDESGRVLRLGDVARVDRRARSGESRVLYRGKAAIELALSRTETGDSLESARTLETWMAQRRPALPPGIEVIVFDQSWELIRDRIMLLVKNGLGGLVLVVLILFLFLNGRVAWWVAVGIPVSFMAALGVLYVIGGSINMVSLFALIMTLGIIVDDAIVVGEDALTHFQAGESPVEAAEGGAWRMLAPVMCSSLTTIAAFLPLMLVGGIIGNILFDIPLVVVCVITASLVEGFLVLPGHLRHAFERSRQVSTGSPMRARLDRGFARFREDLFRPVVTACVRNAEVTVCAALAAMMLCVGLVAGGRISFTFFPSPEATVINADISFVAGTPPARTEAFLRVVEAALYEAEESFDEPIVSAATITLGKAFSASGRGGRGGDQFGFITVQLVEPDLRNTRNPAFIKAWRERITLPPGIENFALVQRRAGPPGRDVDIRLMGNDAHSLKAAALELADALAAIEGVRAVTDDMPYGSQQLIYELTPQARALGLTTDSVGRQLRAAYDGRLAQIFQDGEDEIEVRVMLPDRERYSLGSLESFNLALPDGGSMPLLTAVTLDTRRGFDILRHTDGRLSLRVSADVDPAINNNNRVIARLEEQTLPAIMQRHSTEYDFEGRRADQQETLADMRLGGIYALGMIYIVLAWVFASYGWPLVVMVAIPLGLIGALVGHWVLGIDITLLSLFGLFGLSGIVVNDSIILVVFFKQQLERGVATVEAIIEAACQRLRAVLLTSLTTIAGLLPLLFETSTQAQFLIPMAVSIAFGLAFATVLVLMVIPALLKLHEDVAAVLGKRRGSTPPPATVPT